MYITLIAGVGYFLTVAYGPRPMTNVLHFCIRLRKCFVDIVVMYKEALNYDVPLDTTKAPSSFFPESGIYDCPLCPPRTC